MENRLDWLEKTKCEIDLRSFIKHAWPVLEPGRKFIDGKVIGAVCEHLEAVSSGEIKKLLMNVPPGCMKSLTTNVFWPVWEWTALKRPFYRYVSVSYSHKLTRRDNRKAKQLIKHPRIKSNWPVRLSADEQNIDKFSNEATGFRLATSIGGYVMGERGDRVILDDPNDTAKVNSDAALEAVLQFLTEVLPSRINDPEESAIIIMMQRIHTRDASGHVIANNLGFEKLILPMEYEEERHCTTSIGFTDWRKKENELLWPERFNRRYLDKDLKPTLSSWGGSFAIAGQLQQRPVARKGGMFAYDWVKVVDKIPEGGVTVRGWDLAATSRKINPRAAYTSGVKMRYVNGAFYVMDVFREQIDDSDVEKKVKAAARRDGFYVGIDIPQDPGQSGKSQKTAYSKMLVGYDVRFSPETGSKENRAIPVAAQAEAGNFYVLGGTSWFDAYMAELSMFPVGDFKDQVDATSRAFTRLLKSPTPDEHHGLILVEA